MCVRGNTSRGNLWVLIQIILAQLLSLWVAMNDLLSFFQVPDFKWLNPCVRECWCAHKLHNNPYMEMFMCVTHLDSWRVQDDKDLRCWQVYNGMYMKEPVLEGSSGWEDPPQGVARLLHRSELGSMAASGAGRCQCPGWIPVTVAPRTYLGHRPTNSPFPECSSSPWKVGSGYISRD